MIVLREFPFVMASDASGKLGMWVIPPGISRAMNLFNWQNVDDKGQDSVINAVAVAERLKYVYTADDKGNIKAYSYGSIIEGLGITEPKGANKEFFNRLEGIFVKELTALKRIRVKKFEIGITMEN